MTTYIEPPIDNLNDKVESKYELTYLLSERANEIDRYYRELGEGIISVPGPLNESHANEHPTTTAMNELNEEDIYIERKEIEDKEEIKIDQSIKDVADIELDNDNK